MRILQLQSSHLRNPKARWIGRKMLFIHITFSSTFFSENSCMDFIRPKFWSITKTQFLIHPNLSRKENLSWLLLWLLLPKKVDLRQNRCSGWIKKHKNFPNLATTNVRIPPIRHSLSTIRLNLDKDRSENGWIPRTGLRLPWCFAFAARPAGLGDNWEVSPVRRINFDEGPQAFAPYYLAKINFEVCWIDYVARSQVTL